MCCLLLVFLSLCVCVSLLSAVKFNMWTLMNSEGTNLNYIVSQVEGDVGQYRLWIGRIEVFLVISTSFSFSVCFWTSNQT